MNKSELVENICDGCQARENAHGQVAIAWGFFLIGWESGVRFSNQSQRSKAKTEQMRWHLIEKLSIH